MVPGPHALPGLGQAQPHWHHVKGVGATFMALGWGMGSPGPPHPRAMNRAATLLSRSVNLTLRGWGKPSPYHDTWVGDSYHGRGDPCGRPITLAVALPFTVYPCASYNLRSMSMFITICWPVVWLLVPVTVKVVKDASCSSLQSDCVHQYNSTAPLPAVVKPGLLEKP